METTPTAPTLSPEGTWAPASLLRIEDAALPTFLSSLDIRLAKRT